MPFVSKNDPKTEQKEDNYVCNFFAKAVDWNLLFIYEDQWSMY